MSQNSIKPFLRYYAGISVFLFGFLALLFRSGYSVGSVLLLLGGIYVLIRYRSTKSIAFNDERLVSRDYILITTLCLFSFEAIFNWLWHDFQSNIEKEIRFALAVPIFFLIWRAKPSLQCLSAGLALGAIGAACIAFYEVFALSLGRAHGDQHPIQFGNISLLLGMLCVPSLSLIRTWSSYRGLWVILLLCGVVGGVLASFLSGSRGGWISLPILILLFFFTYQRYFSRKTKVVLIVLSVVLLTVLLMVPQLGVQKRVAETQQNISLYFAGESRTSIGARFEMWQGAIKIFTKYPVFGVGDRYQYKLEMIDLAEAGKIHSSALSEEIAQLESIDFEQIRKDQSIDSMFGHPHNELINQAAKRGVVGVLTLALLYLLPLFAFFPGLIQRDNIPLQAVAASGYVLVLSYICFGLSQVFFAHNSGVMVYATLLMVLAGYYKNAYTCACEC